jgi:hypothetical protein
MGGGTGCLVGMAARKGSAHGEEAATGNSKRPGRSRPPAPGAGEGGTEAALPAERYRAGVLQATMGQFV